ncbi:MAG TPA: hypothetical protein VF808_03150 [Ktedonobacterales bacterium]
MEEHAEQSAEIPKHHDFFDVYRMAIEDLHAAKDLGQKIDSFYVTIVTLLLTADAYEIATTRFDIWTPTAATIGVALIGLAVTARWRQGAGNLYQIVRNRYAWLREAEDPEKHPEMAHLRVDIFTQEYNAVYLSQKRRGATRTASRQRSPLQDIGVSIFYNRTVFLQNLCMTVFLAIPAIIGAATYLNLNPSLLHAIARALP